MSDSPDVFWIDSIADPTFGEQVGGGLLENVHPESACSGEFCVMHNPSDHHMRDFPTNWRGDIRVMERICPHGVGHPDPDDLAYHQRIGQHWVSAHGCDGCCGQPKPT